MNTNNPELHQVPRSQPAAVIPLQRDASILGWLEGTGRMLAREVQEFDYRENTNDEEISDLMAGEDNSFDGDDDDDDALDLDD
jgi:Protein of unknown function (DUF3134)